MIDEYGRLAKHKNADAFGSFHMLAWFDSDVSKSSKQHDDMFSQFVKSFAEYVPAQNQIAITLSQMKTNNFMERILTIHEIVPKK
ncbi:MAG: hypothetical protein QMD97_05550, partial [Candidatus Aenigmarchaeota archaeon]|nr:hypothetical protein [Candidatus Aenigmarchaeota archaeon]